MIGRIVPQHLVLVLPTTGEFDSRSWRIARTCVERGHAVTMLARWKDGLPAEERHPLGFRILRLRASAEDALPSNRVIRVLAAVIGGGASVVARLPGIGRAVAEIRRRTTVLLAMRAQRRTAVREAPAGDLYHGMAYLGIPVALDLGAHRRRPVVYDARDLYLDARNLARMGRIARWFLGRLERGWASRASRVVTVNDGYADVMAGRWPVPRPLVVMNCSSRYTPPSPRERRFHQRFALDPADKVVLYHGGFSRWRGIEQLLDAIDLVPRATLVLMGYGVLEPDLRAREAAPATGGRVQVMDAVPPDELLDWIASADVAAMPIQGDTLNHRLTTPNKLFEAMAAGLPAVVSDLPGMRAIVDDAGCGILVDPTAPAAISEAIRRVTDLPDVEWQAWRERCLAAAHDRYNWETQVAGLLSEYGTLTGQPW